MKKYIIASILIQIGLVILISPFERQKKTLIIPKDKHNILPEEIDSLILHNEIESKFNIYIEKNIKIHEPTEVVCKINSSSNYEEYNKVHKLLYKDSIATNPFLQIDLIGKNIEVSNKSNPKLFISKHSKDLEWRYIFKPNKCGKIKVIFEILSFATDNDFPYKISSIEKDVEVQCGFLYGLRRFLNSNWEWIFGLLNLPIIIYITKKIFNVKKD